VSGMGRGCPPKIPATFSKLKESANHNSVPELCTDEANQLMFGGMLCLLWSGEMKL